MPSKQLLLFNYYFLYDVYTYISGDSLQQNIFQARSYASGYNRKKKKPKIVEENEFVMCVADVTENKLKDDIYLFLGSVD